MINSLTGTDIEELKHADGVIATRKRCFLKFVDVEADIRPYFHRPTIDLKTWIWVLNLGLRTIRIYAEVQGMTGT